MFLTVQFDDRQSVQSEEKERGYFCHLLGQQKVVPKLTGFTSAYNSNDLCFVFILTRPLRPRRIRAQTIKQIASQTLALICLN